jgi:hypothetical protein
MLEGSVEGQAGSHLGMHNPVELARTTESTNRQSFAPSFALAAYRAIRCGIRSRTMTGPARGLALIALFSAVLFACGDEKKRDVPWVTVLATPKASLWSHNNPSSQQEISEGERVEFLPTGVRLWHWHLDPQQPTGIVEEVVGIFAATHFDEHIQYDPDVGGYEDYTPRCYYRCSCEPNYQLPWWERTHLLGSWDENLLPNATTSASELLGEPIESEEILVCPADLLPPEGQ